MNSLAYNVQTFLDFSVLRPCTASYMIWDIGLLFVFSSLYATHELLLRPLTLMDMNTRQNLFGMSFPPSFSWRKVLYDDEPDFLFQLVTYYKYSIMRVMKSSIL